jgi:hypothetical protein
MFKNIGKKIKGLAIIICVINILISIILALLICNNIEKKFVVLLLIFIGIVSFGILMAWISAMFVYAFGQLVDNSDAITSVLRSTNAPNEDMERIFTKEFFRDKNSTIDINGDNFDSTSETTLYVPTDL